MQERKEKCNEQRTLFFVFHKFADPGEGKKKQIGKEDTQVKEQFSKNLNFW